MELLKRLVALNTYVAMGFLGVNKAILETFLLRICLRKTRTVTSLRTVV